MFTLIFLQGVIAITEKISGILVDSPEKFKKLTEDMVKKLGAATMFNIVAGVVTCPHGYDPSLETDNQLISIEFFLLNGQKSPTFTFTLGLLESVTEQLKTQLKQIRSDVDKLKEVLKREVKDKSETYIR